MTLSPQEKRKRTLIKKLGGRKQYLEFMRRLGKKGGENGDPDKKPFAQDKELASRAGSLGAKKLWEGKQ